MIWFVARLEPEIGTTIGLGLEIEAQSVNGLLKLIEFSNGNTLLSPQTRISSLLFNQLISSTVGARFTLYARE